MLAGGRILLIDDPCSYLRSHLELDQFNQKLQRETEMKSFIVATALAALFAMPVYAQTDAENGTESEEATVTLTAEEAQAVAEIISSIGEDQAKTEGYCAIIKDMYAVSEDDEAKQEELGEKMDEYLTNLGDDVAEAFNTADGVDTESEAGQIIEGAFDDLEEKCSL